MKTEDVFSDKTIFLVTGGAGFIGSNLCESLLRKGCTVKCLDNLSTGNIKNVDKFLKNPKFEFIKGDIRDIEICNYATQGVDFVLHEAAWGSVQRSISMPLEYEDINIKGTLNMMEASRKNHVDKFIYASSSSVYGDSMLLPKKEGIEGEVISPYALTKRTNEEYGKLYYKLYGMKTYGLRYFNVFGRRQNPNGDYAAVIPRFITQLLDGERPIIYGDGKQSRDFTYIDNIIEGNFRACLAGEEAAGDVYNIGAGSREYLIDVYYAICDEIGLEVEPRYEHPKKGDIRDSNADISKAVIKLGYKPLYDFSSGLKLTIDWYRNIMNSTDGL